MQIRTLKDKYKKVNFRKGTGTFIYGYIICFTVFLIALVCIEQFSKYNHALDTQITADSLADGVAVYVNNNRCSYDEAVEYARELGETIHNETGVEIQNITINEDDFYNNLINLTADIQYKRTSSVEDYNTNLERVEHTSPYYNIIRRAETYFSLANVYSPGVPIADATNENEYDFLWPLSVDEYDENGKSISSRYGERWGTTHYGIDLPCDIGTPVRAVADGVVKLSYYSDGNGNYTRAAGEYIAIEHGKDALGRTVITQYMHNSERCVQVGDTVSRGQIIAYSGNTGYSTGPHLHFGLKINGVFADSLKPYTGRYGGALGPVKALNIINENIQFTPY